MLFRNSCFDENFGRMSSLENGELSPVWIFKTYKTGMPVSMAQSPKPQAPHVLSSIARHSGYSAATAEL